jgi:hypothetical protein
MTFGRLSIALLTCLAATQARAAAECIPGTDCAGPPPAGPPACTDSQWLDRIFNATWLSNPTSVDRAQFLDQNGNLNWPRAEVAFALLQSRTYDYVLIGAASSAPGYFQKLLGRDPTYTDDLWMYVDALQSSGGFFCPATDEVAMALVLNNNAGEFLLRASLQPESDGRKQVVAQLFIDLLGRGPSLAELSQYAPQVPLDPTRNLNDQFADALANIQAVAESIAELAAALMTTDPLIGPEYRTLVVNRMFQDILRRAPTQFELATFVTALSLRGVRVPNCGTDQQLHINEEAKSLLYASGDYCGGSAQVEVDFPGVHLERVPTLLNTGDYVIAGLQQRSISQLQTQVGLLQMTVTSLQAQLATANNIETSAILDLFGAAADANVAAGSRDVAQSEIQAAIGRVGPADPDVLNAQVKFDQGVAAQTAGDYTRAFVRFRQSYGDAHLGVR